MDVGFYVVRLPEGNSLGLWFVVTDARWRLDAWAERQQRAAPPLARIFAATAAFNCCRSRFIIIRYMAWAKGRRLGGWTAGGGSRRLCVAFVILRSAGMVATVNGGC
jgi:hypothetical protein